MQTDRPNGMRGQGVGLFVLPGPVLLLQEGWHPVSATDAGDFGIVFYGSNHTIGTYVDILGQTRAIQPLVTATQAMMNAAIESAYFHAGYCSRFDLQVELLLGVSCTLDIGLVGRFGDVNALPGLDAYTQLVTFLDSTVTPKTAHTLTASGKYMLQTANLGGVTEGAIRVTPTIVGGGGEFDPPGIADLVVRLRVVK